MKMQDFLREQTSKGVVSVSPMPSSEELAAFYADSYYQETPSKTYSTHYSEDELAHRVLRAELILFALKKVGLKNDSQPSFLEIGCGEGFLLKAAKEYGYEVRGVDFSDYGIQNYHPELIDHIEVGDAYQILQQIFVDQHHRFDVCVMQNVLEHVIDPEDLLHKVKQIMSPGGVVVITVPNDFSRIQAKLMDEGMIENEYWFQPPQHLHYFNVDTINSFVGHCGYSVVDAFADFPIDFFLFHSGSNYVKDSAQGKDAHKARITLDLLLAERGVAVYHQLCQALTACGAGRNVTVLLTAMS
ncbi:MAG: class I SAM-dependent methyltransferase [Proteobacteria bacterium]|nr:class I SAM-dependent methyltransferase [Pseudomonadota bacterium]MBU1715794.1 class I SAM-dependent methyltransferase [Pseudomonadota bacterium]